MKKILCLIIICIFLVGCSNDVLDKSSEPQEEITYTHEDVDATITYIDMRKWFAYVPSFADSQKGDSVTVEVTDKYGNGKLVDRYISGIE